MYFQIDDDTRRVLAGSEYGVSPSGRAPVMIGRDSALRRKYLRKRWQVEAEGFELLWGAR